MAYMNLVTPQQKSGGLLAKKKKGLDWGMLNPLEWKGLGGEREFNPKGAYNKFTDYYFGGDDDAEVRHYTQTGGHEGEAEGRLSFLEGQRQQDIADYMDYGIKTDDSSPELSPDQYGEAVEMPEFAKSQMKSYKDPEISGRQDEEKRVLARMALAQQTPSLAPEESRWWESDKGSGLAFAGGSVAEIGEDPHTLLNRLDFAGTTKRIKDEEEYGKLGRSLGYFKNIRKKRGRRALKNLHSGSDVPGMADDYDVSGEDDSGFATQSTAPTSGLLAKSGDSWVSGDSSGSEGMSVGKMQALLKMGELLSGGTAPDQPAQQQQVLPVLQGRTPNFASTKMPQRQYFRPRGLGKPFDYA